MRRRRRLVLWIMLVVIAALVAVAARPAVHLIKTAYRDRPTMVPPPAGTVDDASRLNQTDVAQIVTLADVAGDTFAAQFSLMHDQATDTLIGAGGAEIWRRPGA